MPRCRNEAIGLMGALAFGLAPIPDIAKPAPPESCAVPAAMADGWPVSSPRQQGLDPTLICAIGSHLEQLREANPHGVVIIRHGVLVHEDYFTGEDRRWPQQHWKQPLPIMPHDAGTKHDVQSVTKSVVALLVGIALDRGLIKTVDTPVLSFFPGYADLGGADRDRITLRDLLTMTSGLKWPTEPYLDTARRMDAATDPYRFVLEQPMAATPGTRWQYNNGSTEVVGGILQKATGHPLDQFVKEALFDPLEITDWEWGRMASGNPGASWGLRLRPRDLAKIGQLILDHGSWHGRQIMSAAWIKEMTEPRIVNPTNSYGYFWWLGRSSVNGRDIDLISAIGWGGQYLDIVPSLDLVVVVTTGVYDFDGAGRQDLARDTVLNDFALPAALGD
jgi:CubicO group peptidase (beta-lactamase class C family)